MVLLSPLQKFNPDVYWRIEGYFFHWLLAMVSMWSWSAGYDGNIARHKVAAIA
jgi:lysophosphatidylglycerol acyltransferase 1